MGRLFGTDGARGVAVTELTCETAMQIGRAAALVLTEKTKHKPKIIIGKDTRISSDILEAALAAGICSIGDDSVFNLSACTCLKQSLTYIGKNQHRGTVLSKLRAFSEFYG